jgi:hypothetical protein
MLMPEIEYGSDGKEPAEMLRFERALNTPTKRANAS